MKKGGVYQEPPQREESFPQVFVEESPFHIRIHVDYVFRGNPYEFPGRAPCYVE